MSDFKTLLNIGSGKLDATKIGYNDKAVVYVDQSYDGIDYDLKQLEVSFWECVSKNEPGVFFSKKDIFDFLYTFKF